MSRMNKLGRSCGAFLVCVPLLTVACDDDSSTTNAVGGGPSTAGGSGGSGGNGGTGVAAGGTAGSLSGGAGGTTGGATQGGSSGAGARGGNGGTAAGGSAGSAGGNGGSSAAGAAGSGASGAGGAGGASGGGGVGGTSGGGAAGGGNVHPHAGPPCNSFSQNCGSVPSGMVCIPSGEFEMGTENMFLQETPIRQVCMPTYYIDRTEVVTSAYKACVSAGACTNPGQSGTAIKCSWDTPGRDAHPVDCVTWDQAKSYCEWSGKRLATEAEWEKAARGIDARVYPWGAERPDCTRAVMTDDNGVDGCGSDATMPPGSRSPAGDSPFGVQDMAGNVVEWVANWHTSAGYDPTDLINPQGAASGTNRVHRGGAYTGGASNLTAYWRNANSPSTQWGAQGIRCASDRQ